MSAAADVKSVFGRALELADPAARAAYLAGACGGNAALRAEVEGLLAALDRAGGFLAPAVSDATGTFPPADPPTATFGDDAATSDRPGRDEHIGAVLGGKYKLVEEIGEGGMGQVFLAQQIEPVRRAVAVKVIKAGMDSKAVLARFDAERQALALMDHPNIAKVLDAGATDSGRPYFVMELVKGVPITEYCDAHKLTPRERLELFVPVCQALQHAHQKGVIHRDVKPSNVLVALYDDRPVPKVIDFGIAKAAGPALTDRTLMTGFGAVVGTPEYMSPEQASLNNLDVDTRSDVYALGVLLYELLTGTTPVDRKSLGQAAVLEVLRMVREVEAPRPSAKLSSSETLPRVAANRSTEPGRLSRLMRGELDWVVLKALEKDRGRRYETANALGRDVQRYLADEVVEARPPSAGYRVQKFVRRHKGQVVAASLVLVALVAGMAGTTWGLIRAQRSAAAERAAREREAARAEGERQAKEEAEANLALATKGNAILGSVFEKLEPANCATLAELRTAMGDNLTRAVRELDGAALGDRVKVAEMQTRLGLALCGLGKWEDAVAVLERARAVQTAALGPDHPDTVNTVNHLAAAYLLGGQPNQIVSLLEPALPRVAAALGPDHTCTIQAMNTLAAAYRDLGQWDRALRLFEEALARARAKPDPDPTTIHLTLHTLNNLGAGYSTAGRHDRAVPVLEESLALHKARLGPEHRDTLIGMNNLAQAYQESAQTDRAIRLYEEAFALHKNRLGPDHPSTLHSMNGLATALADAGKTDRALRLYEEALPLTAARLGPDHRETLTCMNNLAMAYHISGQTDRALRLFEEALARQKDKLGPTHRATLTTLTGFATVLCDAGKLDRATRLYEEALANQTAALGPDHRETLQTASNLAFAYQAAGRGDRARPLFERVLARQTATLGPDHPNTLATMKHFAWSCALNGELDRAAALSEAAVPRLERRYGPDHPLTRAAKANGAFVRDLLAAEARYHARSSAAGPTDIDTLLARRDVAQMYMATNRLDDAEGALAEILQGLNGRPADDPIVTFTLGLLAGCLDERTRRAPDDWRTFNTRTLLGGALVDQKKYADADRFLLRGYEGLKAREKQIPPQAAGRIPEALDRLVELYTATDKPDEAKKWRAERAKYPPPVAPPPREKK